MLTHYNQIISMFTVGVEPMTLSVVRTIFPPLHQQNNRVKQLFFSQMFACISNLCNVCVPDVHTEPQ